jgi:hypothetical protein
MKLRRSCMHFNWIRRGYFSFEDEKTCALCDSRIAYTQIETQLMAC